MTYQRNTPILRSHKQCLQQNCTSIDVAHRWVCKLLLVWPRLAVKHHVSFPHTAHKLDLQQEANEPSMSRWERQCKGSIRPRRRLLQDYRASGRMQQRMNKHVATLRRTCVRADLRVSAHACRSKHSHARTHTQTVSHTASVRSRSQSAWNTWAGPRQYVNTRSTSPPGVLPTDPAGAGCCPAACAGTFSLDAWLLSWVSSCWVLER